MIRTLTPSDFPAVLALNDAHAAEVNALGAEGLASLVAIAAHALVVDDANAKLEGFVIVLDERTPPCGPNHGWFAARHSAFSYVDRIVVDAASRGRGVARALYEHVAALHPDRPVCCEVNIDPPNPVSLAFHERLGFRAVGEAVDPRNGKRVRYLMRG
jgi:predicted GNAT superfamily acetyltransferase